MRNPDTMEITHSFRWESDLVQAFCRHLDTDASPFGHVSYTREFDYQRGRTDIVAVDKSDTIYAFEAKLSNWKMALHQAYRNSCFAHATYVVMPRDKAREVLFARYEFERRSVGLCTIDDNGLTIYIHAREQKPLQPSLSESAFIAVFGIVNE